MKTRRKLNVTTIIVLLFLNAFHSFVFSQEVFLYKDFPIYPTTEITEEIKNSTANSINLNFISTELKNKRFQRPDHSIFQSVSLEINKAIDYLQKEANVYGWIEMDRGVYEDGGSDYLTFVKKQKDHIAIVGVNIWHPMIVDGYPVPEKWGTITYNFTEYPIPYLHKGFPLFPSVKETSDCKISNDFYGNEVVTVGQGEFFQGIEPFSFLYANQSVFPKLYGWLMDSTILAEKDHSKGSQLFFLKDNNIVKVVEDFNNKSVIFIFFTPEQSREIILNKTQKSPTRQEQLLEKLREVPRVEKKSQNGEFEDLVAMFNKGLITKEEFRIREREIRERLRANPGIDDK